MYAILDLESTGGKYKEEAITEVAIYKFDGEEIVDQFGSLVNPEKKIQPFVVRLTGINNDMLRYAPKFYEVAKRIIEITEDCILVAHNAKFDYHLLQEEFKRLGYNYKRKTLCTVELSKNLIPEMPSYSLGKLVQNLGIPITNRHRAFGDALATVKLFKLLLSKDVDKEIIGTAVNSAKPKSSQHHLLDIIEDLPTAVGIFYMHDKNGKIIFLSKTSNIRQKVNQYFTKDHLKAKLIQKDVESISYELTGNKLIATLKEREELQALKPKYNTEPLPQTPFKYGLYQYKEGDKTILNLKKFDGVNNLVTPFKSLSQAERFIERITQKYKISSARFETQDLLRKKFYSRLNKYVTNNPLIKEEEQEKNIHSLVSDYSLSRENILLVGPGRQPAEKSVLLIENNKFKGVAYIDLNYQLNNIKMLHNLLTPMTDSVQAKLTIQEFFQKDFYKTIAYPK